MGLGWTAFGKRTSRAYSLKINFQNFSEFPEKFINFHKIQEIFLEISGNISEE